MHPLVGVLGRPRKISGIRFTAVAGSPFRYSILWDAGLFSLMTTATLSAV
jgi:hypothetical protein